MARDILILTGDQIRHQWFSQQLSKKFPIRAVFAEAFQYPEPAPGSEQERIAWDWFFSRRQKYEDEHFSISPASLSGNRPEIIPVPQGELNSPNTIAKINAFAPNIILVYGTSILGAEMLRLYPRSIINLHVGLPQYYRGSSCNIWPIINAELDRLGACVHRIDAGIDTGAILAQANIDLFLDDDEQSLAGKSLIMGLQLIASVIENWRDDEIKELLGNKKGKLYLMKDFTPAVTLKLKHLVEFGRLNKMIADSLAQNSQ